MPNFQAHSEDQTVQNQNCYRILADQILAKAQPVLNFYNNEMNLEESEEDEKEAKDYFNCDKSEINNNGLNGHEREKCVDEDKNLIFLKNGFAVDSKNVISKRFF